MERSVKPRIGLYGPHWPIRIDRREELGNYIPFDEPPIEAAASTLGEAIEFYAKRFGIEFRLYDRLFTGAPFMPEEAPKYFVYDDKRFTDILVDIHIRRGETEICPKQNLAFPLEAGDLVLIDRPIC